MKRLSAAALVIGDEILTGKVRDTNSHHLAKFLFQRGISLQRVWTIPDSIHDISSSLRFLSPKHDYVFTSGGIGCTLDDKTYAGVAHAFDRDLELHTPTFEKMESWFQQKGHAENPVRARMATFPSRSRVVTLDGLWVPLVVTENVHTYPGVPYLFERMLAGAASEYVSQVGPKTRRLVFTQKTEEEIAAVLDAAQLEFRGEVNLGSYPQFHLGKGQNAPYRVMLTFEADDADECNACAQWVSERVNGFSLPEDVLKQVHGIDMFT